MVGNVPCSTAGDHPLVEAGLSLSVFGVVQANPPHEVKH
jgi:hypothetical protein